MAIKTKKELTLEEAQLYCDEQNRVQMKDWFHRSKMDENVVEMVQIKEIQLNPRFCS